MKKILLFLLIVNIVSCRNEDEPKEQTTNSESLVNSWQQVFSNNSIYQENDSLTLVFTVKSDLTFTIYYHWLYYSSNGVYYYQPDSQEVNGDYIVNKDTITISNLYKTKNGVFVEYGEQEPQNITFEIIKDSLFLGDKNYPNNRIRYKKIN